MPITWRNINAPNFSDSNRLLDNAGQSISRSLQGAESIATDLITKDQQNTDKRSEAFLEAIKAQYGNNPEALARAQQSGAIDQLKSQYGKLNASTTNTSALNSILDQARARQTTQREYADSEQRFNNKDARESFGAAIAGRDFELANQISSETDWLNPSVQANLLANAQDAETTRLQQASDRQQRLADASVARADANNARERKKLEQERADNDYNLDRSINQQIGEFILNKTDDNQFYKNEEKALEDRINQSSLDGSKLMDESYIASLNPEQFQEAQSIIQQAKDIKDIAPNNKKARQEFIKDLISQGASGDQLNNALGVTQNIDSTLNGKTPEEKAAYESAVNTMETRPEYLQSQLVQDYKNPTPLNQGELLAELGESYDALSVSAKNNINRTLDKIKSNGYKNKDGEVMLLPKALIKTALQRISIKTGFVGNLFTNRALDDEIETLIDSGSFANEFNALEAYKEEKAGIENKFNSNDTGVVSNGLSTLNIDKILNERKAKREENVSNFLFNR